MRRDSAVSSLLIHAIAMLFLFGIVFTTAPVTQLRAPLLVIGSKLAPYSPTPGAGGQRDKTQAKRRPAAARSLRVFIPPVVVPPNPAPKPVMETALDIPPDMKLPDSNLLDIGDPAGLGKLLSGGSGGPGGIGDGPGRSVGSSPGSGAGERGVYIAGRGGVSLSVAIRKVEPEYSEEARKARAMGTVVVAVEIGPDGKPRNLRVTRSFGMGLDEKALEAVAQWLFRPGTMVGRAVTVAAQIEVAFHLL